VHVSGSGVRTWVFIFVCVSERVEHVYVSGLGVRARAYVWVFFVYAFVYMLRCMFSCG